ncbi:hypothetical protein AURDEDRAFT_165492 [Auricularia subglabra TFB-10046 SS5]|nr:hypothetical protein AURDEDRAFT_165492 [Auricularia subglabra TFB-10046 SS5]
MLKGMLAKVASSPASAAILAAEGSASAVSSAEFSEAQRNFDAYRLEIGEDNRRLEEDLLAAQREVGAVSAALAKANATITTLEESSRSAQEEIHSQKRAKDSLQAQVACTETSHSEMLEQHALTAGQAETLRIQVVQVMVEREGVEARLSAENRSLASQRTHLTDLMSCLRKMQKDLEVAEEGDERLWRWATRMPCPQGARIAPCSSIGV